MIKRDKNNPIITIKDVKPSSEDLIVMGVFNAGVTIFNDEIILLLRVAETFKEKSDKYLFAPYYEKGKIKKKSYKLNDKSFDFSDSRVILNKARKKIEGLTSLSHFRLAKSKDGVNFEVAEKPTLSGKTKYESWGIEDARITKMGNNYYILYSAISQYGVLPSMIVTKDFCSFSEPKTILPPENKDVVLFPEKINNKYHLLHRPVPFGIGNLDIWLSTSDDLVHWGNHKHLLSVSERGFDSGRVGAGGVPIKTPHGWLIIYHAADKNNNYSLTAALLSLEEPEVVSHKLNFPLLKAEEDYEKEGFFNNVVFSCGEIVKKEIIYLYYGAADDKMALARIDKKKLLNLLIEKDK